MRIILQRQKQFWQKMLVQPERLYFFLRFAQGIMHVDRCDRKTPKTSFIQVKSPFLVVEVSNAVTFWRNTRFDVV